MQSSTPPFTRQAALALDAADPLRHLRERFDLPPGLIYLDGNSLGALPKATTARVADVVQREWGQDLITSWNKAGWFASPQRVGDLLAPLIGAKPGEVLCTDSISVNLYKLLFAAISIATKSIDSETEGQKPSKTIVSEADNFPTDLYIAHSLATERGWTLKAVQTADLRQTIAANPGGIVMLTHVNYRTGAMHNMAELTALAHAHGSLALWDLAHSAGAVEVDLHAAGADFAVGCGYKYLNGGPGAPAFLWVAPQHAGGFEQPLAGWWGHAAPFAFTPDYKPAPGVGRYLCGTQPVVQMAALECGLQVFAEAQTLGGMAALRKKSLALTDLFAQTVLQRCAGFGIALVSPVDQANRGSQVCLTRQTGDAAADSAFGYAVLQALIARGVVGDFRAGQPPIMRFGFAPLYNSFADAFDAAEHLHAVLQSAEWQAPQFQTQGAVT